MNKNLLACLLILIANPLAAETYKWVNEDGVVTYSQTPPPGQKAETVKLRKDTPASGPSSKDRLDQLRQRMADSAEDRGLKKQEQQEEREAKKLKQQNCQAARSNLTRLNGLGNRLYQQDGEYKRLSEEERQRLMKQARENIKNNCAS